MSNVTNPFPAGSDHHEIWEMLVARDILAFCRADWSMVAEDFVAEGFMGIDAGKTNNPDDWKLGFPDLESYKDEWLDQAAKFLQRSWKEDPIVAFHRLTTLQDMDIQEHTAVAHKKFDGTITSEDGQTEYLNWQTLYRCRKVDGVWKIAGFVGYMPYPMGARSAGSKAVPPGASQHVTAGPYSPVLVVDPQRLVVISGQAALNPAGEVLGETIEEQAVATLENCRTQLATAGCNLSDVFKVNVYLKDLDDWPRFNAVYERYFPEPRPVRTAVQTPLLMTFLVEIELWAVK